MSWWSAQLLLIRTGQQISSYSKRAVDQLLSYELELAYQFPLSELIWNCHTPNPCTVRNGWLWSRVEIWSNEQLLKGTVLRPSRRIPVIAEIYTLILDLSHFRFPLHRVYHWRKWFRSCLGDGSSKIGSDALWPEEKCKQETSQISKSQSGFDHRW